jgi:hypothetical protein
VFKSLILQSSQNKNNYVNRILAGEQDSEIEGLQDSAIETLNAFQALSEKHGFGITLVLIPVSAQIATEYPDNLYQGVLTEYAKSAGLDHLDLLPDFRAYFDQHGVVPVIPYDGLAYATATDSRTLIRIARSAA